MNLYMHTIDGMAAFFDGQQICYAATRRPLKLCRTMREIKAQRRLSDKWRRSQGFQLTNYGFQYVAGPGKAGAK